MTGTTSPNTTALTATNAYTSIKDSIVKLKKLGIRIEEIKVVLSSETEGLLFEDIKFANSAGTLGAELIRNGVVGKIVGAETYTSALLPEGVEYIVFGTAWAQAIDEWRVNPSINPIMNGAHIGSSALQGRFINKAVLTVPSAAIIKTATVTAP